MRTKLFLPCLLSLNYIYDFEFVLCPNLTTLIQSFQNVKTSRFSLVSVSSAAKTKAKRSLKLTKTYSLHPDTLEAFEV